MKLSFISDELTKQDMEFAENNGFRGLEANIHIALGQEQEDRELSRLEDRVEVVREDLGAHGLDLAGLGVWELNLIDEHVQERCLDYYERVLRLAERLNCSVVYHGAGSIEGADKKQQIARYLRIAPTVLDVSKKHNVRACLYCGDLVNFAWDPDTWDALFSNLPELGLKYDPSHLVHKRKPYYEPLATFMSKFGNRVYHVHMKDVLLLTDGSYFEPPPGMGQIDWSIIIGLLLRYRYDGFLSIELRDLWEQDNQMRQLGLRLGKKYLERFLL